MIDLDMTVEEALESQPKLAGLFVRHHMICIGCDIARFHTLREAALMYHLDLNQLVRDMQHVLEESQGTLDATTSSSQST